MVSAKNQLQVVVILIFIFVVLGILANINSKRKYSPSKLSHQSIDNKNDYRNDKYNLYSWRTNPPPNYPQNTFNTPYNIHMRKCSRMCNSGTINITEIMDDPVGSTNCLMSCHIQALKKSIAADHKEEFQMFNKTRPSIAGVNHLDG